MKRVLSLLALTAVAVVLLFLFRPAGESSLDAPPAPARATPRVSYVFGAYHDLEVRAHKIFQQGAGALGGALEVVDGERLLVVTGDGRFMVVEHVDAALQSRTLPWVSPLETETYLTRHPNPLPAWYRVNDALLEDGTGSRSLFLSYTHWDPESDCYALRLAEATVDVDAPDAPVEWTLRHQTRPCLELPFLVNGTGGRMALLDRSTLLMTVGDHGWITPEQMTDPGRDYGRVLAFDRRDWTVEVFTTGHRNPQGLLVDGGKIWSTEHGPHGGDELNLLVKGEDYGWPTDSYGTDYGRKTLEHGRRPGDHSRGRRPVFSWTPSIAVSNLVRLSGAGFPAWEGDLMLGSLIGKGNGTSLFRVRVREGRAVGVEKFKLRQAVRDLVQLPDGRLALWNGAGSLQFVSSANHVFAPCAACHGMRDASHGVGPDLMGVVDRDVGAHDDFAYSSALLAFGGAWTEERLDAFLENPAATVPGTTMEFVGLPDPEQRAAIIHYLREMELPQ